MENSQPLQGAHEGVVPRQREETDLEDLSVKEADPQVGNLLDWVNTDWRRMKPEPLSIETMREWFQNPPRITTPVHVVSREFYDQIMEWQKGEAARERQEADRQTYINLRSEELVGDDAAWWEFHWGWVECHRRMTAGKRRKRKRFITDGIIRNAWNLRCRMKAATEWALRHEGPQSNG